MFAYIQFAEDYFPVITTICRELKRQVSGLEFSGIAVRRKTICVKIDAVADELNIKAYEWLNDIEKQILSTAFDEKLMLYYIEKLGSQKLRFIIDADNRYLSPGYSSGGVICRSKFSSLVNSSDKERWKYVIGLVDHFTRLFESKRPDFIFLNEITFAWEVAIYFVAENMNIPCLSLAYMRGCRSYCITDDIYGMIPQRDDLYRRSFSNPALLDKFFPEAKKLVSDFRSRPLNPDGMDVILKQLKKQVTLCGVFRRLIKDIGIIAVLHFKLYGTRGVLR